MEQPHLTSFQPALDESTKLLIEKARAVRSRPMWEPEPEVANYDRPQQQQQQSFERPSPYQPFERPAPYESRLQRDPEDTVMSSKTRSLLDKVKESTMALSDICLLYTSPSPRDGLLSRMPSSA